MSPVFPTLAGQGFSIHKKPTFSTLVASHVSGREVRDALYANPIWQFELTFDGLDGTTAGQYGALGAASLQSLMGLFLQCQGQYGSFLYYDPTDYSVSNQTFGVGDGATTNFQLTRSLGGFNEWVAAPLAPAAPTLLPLPGGTSLYAPTNLTPNSTMQGAVVGSPGALPSGWSVWSANGITASVAGLGTVGGLPYIDLDFTGTPTASFFVMAIEALIASTGGERLVGSYYTALTAGSLTNVASLSCEIRDSIGTSDASFMPTVTLARASVARTLASGASWAVQSLSLGLTTGQPINFTLRLAAPQLEIVTAAQSAPSPFNPTFGSAYYGGPQISLAGIMQNPSTYSVTNPGGGVTFATAPAAGAALTWSGAFGFLCRFDGDDLDFEQFMANLWKAESVKFRSLRAQ